LYFFSGAEPDLRVAAGDEVAEASVMAAGIQRGIKAYEVVAWA